MEVLCSLHPHMRISSFCSGCGFLCNVDKACSNHNVRPIDNEQLNLLYNCVKLNEGNSKMVIMQQLKSRVIACFDSLILEIYNEIANAKDIVDKQSLRIPNFSYANYANLTNNGVMQAELIRTFSNKINNALSTNDYLSMSQSKELIRWHCNPNYK